MVLRIWVNGTSPYCGEALAALALDGWDDLAATKFSTSLFTIRPPSPLPVTAWRSMPVFEAIDLARGEVFILDSLSEAVVTFSSTAIWFSGVLVKATAGSFGLLVGSAALLSPARIALKSSSFPPITARMSFTGTGPSLTLM